MPVLHITGNVNTYEQIGAQKGTKGVRQIGFQETDIVSIVKPITKYAVRIKKSSEIQYQLEKASRIAVSGRPGPVLVDIPMDIQHQKIILKKNIFIKMKKIKKAMINNNIRKIHNLVKLIHNSKRPVLLIGGGVRNSNTTKELKKIIHQLNMPIVATWSGVDGVAHKEKNYIGTIGVYGTRSANLVVQNSDLLISLGSRLDTRVTGGKPETFAKNAKVVAIDIDKNELSKKRGLNLNTSINLDLRIFFPILNKILYKKRKYKFNYRWTDWVSLSKEWMIKYPIIQKKYYLQKNYVNPYVFFDKLSKVLKNTDIIIGSTGSHLTWTLQSFKLKEGQRLFSAFGNSPMGYALPASIGACIALGRKKRIICIDGDGSLQINVQELQTIFLNKLPIKLIVINNMGYGIIKQFKELYLDTKPDHSWKGISNPNFKDLAFAYKMKYFAIDQNKKITKTVKKFTNYKGASFLEVKIDPGQKIIPKLKFGDSIENLSPYLPEKEMKKNMISSK